MQLGRDKTSLIDSGKLIPEEWREKLIKILTKNYEEQSEKDDRFFDVYGKIFDKEILIIISYVHHSDPLASPIALFISQDIATDDKKMKESVESMTDLSGMIFDNIFNTKEWCEYINHWTENKFDNFNFYYKLTRENISLTLQTQEFLEKSGEI